MHYADRCDLDGARGGPAAFFALCRSDQSRHLFLVDDGRALSHRSLLALFREHPHVWKHRSARSIGETSAVPEAPPRAPEEWGTVEEPFPASLDLSPTTLRGVVCVNQTQSIDGVTLAVTSLERFAGGARAHYLCHAPGRRFREEAGALDAIAVDDGGRMYRVAALERRQRGIRIEGSLALGPAVPADARMVTITIGTLGPDAGGEGLPGPWVFPIPLDARP
jgi:hypothetical protein